LAGIEAQENASPVPIPLEKRSSVSSYATLLAYAALAGVGIKAEKPSYDYTSIFEDRTKGFAKLAEGSTGDNGDCLDGVRQAFMTDIIKFMNEDSKNKVMLRLQRVIVMTIIKTSTTIKNTYPKRTIR